MFLEGILHAKPLPHVHKLVEFGQLLSSPATCVHFFAPLFRSSSSYLQRWVSAAEEGKNCNNHLKLGASERLSNFRSYPFSSSPPPFKRGKQSSSSSSFFPPPLPLCNKSLLLPTATFLLLLLSYYNYTFIVIIDSSVSPADAQQNKTPAPLFFSDFRGGSAIRQSSSGGSGGSGSGRGNKNRGGRKRPFLSSSNAM